MTCVVKINLELNKIIVLDDNVGDVDSGSFSSVFIKIV